MVKMCTKRAVRSFCLSFLVYNCYYYCGYFYIFVPTGSVDGLRRKTHQKVYGHIVDTETGDSGDDKIQKLHNITREELNMYATAQWNYHTNRTESSTNKAIQSSIRLFLYQKLLITLAKNLSLTFGLNYEELLPSVYFIHNRGICQLDLCDYKSVILLKSKLKTILNELSVCEYRKTKEPCDITANKMKFIMVNSSDPTELKYYWKTWHNYTAYEVKNIYLKYIGLQNQMAKINNVSNEVEYSLKPYLSNECHLDVDKMYESIKPLYLQLHTRARKVLRDKFGAFIVPIDGPIPVHLLGSVLGQPWINLLPHMIEKRIVPENRNDSYLNIALAQLFNKANRYFNSIGMGYVPKNVWNNSIFRENEHFADCIPSTWDMYNYNDYRIKMCFHDTMDDVYTMHKQLGLIHYFLSYKNQPIAFQHTPEAVFTDGLVNALTLSAQYQDFIDRFNDSSHTRHAFLLRTALKKVTVLPFAYAAEAWHSNVFKGSFAPKRMNDFWWSRRFKYEGVVSPISRGSDKCTNPSYKPFDPSASYSILTELPNIRLVMSKGSSSKWSHLLETIVGHQKIQIEPLLEYFQPLYSHLRLVNNETDEYIGWKMGKHIF